jgi:hypothetical protein
MWMLAYGQVFLPRGIGVTPFSRKITTSRAGCYSGSNAWKLASKMLLLLYHPEAGG